MGSGTFGRPEAASRKLVTTSDGSFFCSVATRSETWRRAIALVASGAVDLRPMITHRYDLARGIEAFELLRARGEHLLPEEERLLEASE